nr:DnaJ domain-containing protein [uncultured Sediminibacterium sp.]
MFPKDYYHILKIPSSASADDIRKAYRRLALLMHPDKNTSPGAAEAFIDIIEAYEILGNPASRKKYDRLSNIQTNQHTPVAKTPEDIYSMIQSLGTRLQVLNPDRINRDKLSADIDAILSVYHIQLLERFQNEHYNTLITAKLLECCIHLEKEDYLLFATRLSSIKGLTQSILDNIASGRKNYLRNYYWHRYKIWLALLIALIFCALLYIKGPSL